MGASVRADSQKRKPAGLGEARLVGDLERPSRQDIAAVLVAIIDRQAERMPTKVGGPVDVIVLTANGTEWVHREPESECPDRE